MPFKLLFWFVLAWLGCFSGAQATPVLTPPPRTVADILTLLDQYKPDPGRIDALRAKLVAPPPTDDRLALARFYFDRSWAADAVGSYAKQMADLAKAADYAKGTGELEVQILQDMAVAERHRGNLLRALRLRDEIDKMAASFGRTVSLNAGKAIWLVMLGDLEGARSALNKASFGYGRVQNGPNQNYFASMMHLARAAVAEGERRWDEAETQYHKAIDGFREELARAKERAEAGQMPAYYSPSGYVEIYANWHDTAEMSLVDFLIKRDRLDEAEVAVRNVLARSLARLGRANAKTARLLSLLGLVLHEKGRDTEALAIARASVKAYELSGAIPENVHLNMSLRRLGHSLVAQERWHEAIEVFERMRAGLSLDVELAQRTGTGDREWGYALIRTGKAGEAVPMLRDLLARAVEQHGYETSDTALLKGVLGMALAQSGERETALKAFAEAVAVLEKQEGDSLEWAPAKARRVAQIIEAYIVLLLENKDAIPRQPGFDPVAEAFRLADLARGQSVQQAVASAAARAALNDPQLKTLARREQDLQQELRALHGYLANMMSAPPEQQLPKVVADMRKRIGAIAAERKDLLDEIKRRAPRYAELLRAPLLALDDARRLLRPGETLLSVLVGVDRSIVWAIPQSGAPAYAVLSIGDAEMRRRVTHLRRALDAQVAALENIPPFDVSAAQDLFDRLLKPVEAGWRDAAALYVVANGGLDQLPFGLLPTGKTSLGKASVRFAEYRQVPWLVRRIAVTQLPAVGSLSALRGLQAGSPARLPFVGFGDPQFSLVASERQASSAMRNLKFARQEGGARFRQIEWQSYASIPSLPDTREEILAIAQALKANPDRDVFLGAAASKKKLLSFDLASRKVIAFATHGLIPGDFPGLSQPALALAQPEDPNENGLLKLDEILGLTLDADWVVLSACNTAAGDGAGAEAISGLGRGFFYAGSRALLVTHWPVESHSARMLVTGLFERFSTSATMSRAEALRQSMLSVMNLEEKGISYAHPMFWAPYALVGDGGR